MNKKTANAITANYSNKHIMIRTRIQIGDGEIQDMFEAHKLIYMTADNRTEAPIKKRDVSSYAEQAGENTDPRTVQDAFDYKAIFIIDGQDRDLERVNEIIAAFNRQLYTQEAGSDIRTYKEVTFYNDFKPCKIVGIPEPIAECKEFSKSKNGYEFAKVELKIRVSDPKKCDFQQTSLVIYLETDGQDILVQPSRTLRPNESAVLLTRGKAKRYGKRPQSIAGFRWHVPHLINGQIQYDLSGNALKINKIDKDSGDPIYTYSISEYLRKKCHIKQDNIRIPLGRGSNCILGEGYPSYYIRYAVAVYEQDENIFIRQKRVSNVAYFKAYYYSNFDAGTKEDKVSVTLSTK